MNGFFDLFISLIVGFIITAALFIYAKKD